VEHPDGRFREDVTGRAASPPFHVSEHQVGGCVPGRRRRNGQSTVPSRLILRKKTRSINVAARAPWSWKRSPEGWPEDRTHSRLSRVPIDASSMASVCPLRVRQSQLGNGEQAAGVVAAERGQRR
jgi:hypothetical protein